MGDAVTTPPAGDAGGDAVVDAATDARTESGAPTCFGQPFTTPRQITAATGDGGAFVGLYGPRVWSNNVYLSGIPYGTTFDMYRAAWPASLPATVNLGVLTPITSLNGSDLDWPPTISDSGAYVVFARGPVGSRNLFVGTGAVNAWPTVGAIPSTTINTSDDEADPWLAGKPPAALYFTRLQSSGSIGTIQRAPVTAQTPAFGNPVAVTVSCGAPICATPLTTPDESILVFASWDSTGGFMPTVKESHLTKSGSNVTADAPVPHPELGNRYPSWISDDACTVIVAHGEANQLYVATRTPK